MLWQYTKRDAVKNFFPLPNELFSLGLSPGALAVYSYLLYCEDRRTYQCYPGYRSIGKAVRMSINTVRKYVAELEEQGLIVTESTSMACSTDSRANHYGCSIVFSSSEQREVSLRIKRRFSCRPAVNKKTVVWRQNHHAPKQNISG